MKREMFFKRIHFKNTSRFGAYGKINSEYPWENAKTNLKGIPDEIQINHYRMNGKLQDREERKNEGK